MINFSDPQARYLIDYSNIRQGLIKYQTNFLSEKQFKKFLKKKYLGCPLVLPLGIKYFDYSQCKEIYKISKKDVKKFIFECKNTKYVGMKIFFKYGEYFCTGATIKTKYVKHFKSITKFNYNLISLIKKYSKNYLTTSFQTRNIPHMGHEKIINRVMDVNKIVFINPLIGIKKEGDCKNIILKNVFNFLLKLKDYKNKVIYAPVVCNMNYAGPREAMHHAHIREILGFDEFSVGRDHAGAQNNYPALAALKFVKMHIKKLKIKIFFHNGAYFCKTCKTIVLKGDCNHIKLTEISGSEFRKKLISKRKFQYMRYSLQKYIGKFKKKLFY